MVESQRNGTTLSEAGVTTESGGQAINPRRLATSMRWRPAEPVNRQPLTWRQKGGWVPLRPNWRDRWSHAGVVSA